MVMDKENLSENHELLKRMIISVIIVVIKSNGDTARINQKPKLVPQFQTDQEQLSPPQLPPRYKICTPLLYSLASRACQTHSHWGGLGKKQTKFNDAYKP